MPALQPPARILVTGATGFIAIWIVRSLLDAGFSVRGTARSHSKLEYLQKKFAKEMEAGRFETVVVGDIELPGAFDKAVQGVDGIIHAASPVTLGADHPDELIKPAVQGTVGIFESVLKHNKECHRIVLLSSTAAIIQQRTPYEDLLTENDWNDRSVQEVKEKGRGASGPDKYFASKVLAERAAWEFYNKYKGQVNWDIVSLNPPFVYGPTIHELSSPDSLGSTPRQTFDILCKPYAGGKTDEELAMGGTSWVDVRNIAIAHVKALLTEKAGGERIIIGAGTFTWQDVLDVLHSRAPATIYKGVPGAGKNVLHPNRYDNSKSKKLLGMEYRPLEDAFNDALKDFEERGWIKSN